MSTTVRIAHDLMIDCGTDCETERCLFCFLPTAKRLAANIATAALGCAAFKFGRTDGIDIATAPALRKEDAPWKPGCQRPAPGWNKEEK